MVEATSPEWNDCSNWQKTVSRCAIANGCAQERPPTLRDRKRAILRTRSLYGVERAWVTEGAGTRTPHARDGTGTCEVSGDVSNEWGEREGRERPSVAYYGGACQTIRWIARIEREGYTLIIDGEYECERVSEPVTMCVCVLVYRSMPRQTSAPRHAQGTHAHTLTGRHTHTHAHAHTVYYYSCQE
jgi:hypothetical protein